jgi:hypothetical protein
LIVIAFFFDREGTLIGNLREELLIWVTIIGGFTLLLGGVSITRINWAKVRRHQAGWVYNLLTLVSVFVMMIPALLGTWFKNEPLLGREEGSIYDWIFFWIDYPMMATMFAMLAFYIASAAYRAFRARNPEATLLLITATLVMLWRIPMGEAFLRLFSDSLPQYINMFVMSGVNTAVQRGILIGAALGAASMSLRIMLGIERTYMGRG